MPGTQGPHVAAAFFCEKILREADGVLSAIRLIDRITITASGDSAPEQMPPGDLPLNALVVLKSDAARGSYTVKVRPEAPSGQRLAEQAFPVLLEGEDRGAGLVLQMNLHAEEEGLYWFDVLLGDQTLTRIPLRLVYRRLQSGIQGS